MSAQTSMLRRRDALHTRSLHYGPNMTPMVDVVMVILIFFMAGTTFIGRELLLRSAVETAPGRAGETRALELPPVQLDLRLRAGPDETLVTGLGRAEVTIDEAAALLGALVAGTPADEVVVTIVPDPDVPYADVVRLHSACHRAGIRRTAIGAAP